MGQHTEDHLFFNIYKYTTEQEYGTSTCFYQITTRNFYGYILLWIWITYVLLDQHTTTHHCGSPVKEAGYTQEEEEEEDLLTPTIKNPDKNVS